MPRFRVGDVLSSGSGYVQVLCVEPHRALVIPVNPSSVGECSAFWATCSTFWATSRDMYSARTSAPAPGSILRGWPTWRFLSEYFYIQSYLPDGRAHGYPVQIWDALHLEMEEDDVTQLVMNVEEHEGLRALHPHISVGFLRSQLFALTSFAVTSRMPASARLSSRKAAIRTLKTQHKMRSSQNLTTASPVVSSEPTIWDNITEDD